ncbi:MAG: glycerophosphodiester phosphodiesterase [Planctomycetes bacterium]|nr:glycerophosphodiester phosphodiesterase [Planctomycetota bacterium]
MSKPELIAHRGYARHYPENTLAAVEAALQVGARAVEIDVQLSRDRVPFLMHDRTLERMCGVPGSIGELLAVEVEQLRAAESARFGERFAAEPVASLARFVELVARHDGVHAFVELKRASLERFGPDAVLDAVVPRLEPLAQRCTLISFDVQVLQRARQRFPLRIGPVLISWGQYADGQLAPLSPDIVFCDLDKLPAQGALPTRIPLAVYEVDDAVVARALAARGVRFVETFAIGELQRELA